MRIALELGWYNVRAMLRTGEPGQLQEWEEYYQQEPFGRQWHQNSMVAATFANVVESLKRNFAGEKLEKKDVLDYDYFVPGKRAEAANQDLSNPAIVRTILRGMAGV